MLLNDIMIGLIFKINSTIYQSLPKTQMIGLKSSYQNFLFLSSFKPLQHWFLALPVSLCACNFYHFFGSCGMHAPPPFVLVSICTVDGGLKLPAKLGSTYLLHIQYQSSLVVYVFPLWVNITTRIPFIHLLNWLHKQQVYIYTTKTWRLICVGKRSQRN